MHFSAGSCGAKAAITFASRMPAPLLELRQIAKSFGGARALKGVDFDLQAGEVHALLGENGAGKSTLIKIITGAHQPDRGTIAVAGQAVADLTPASARAQGIACVYQQPALFPDLTVAENIGLRLDQPTALRRVDWSSRRTHANELLQRIGAAISPTRRWPPSRCRNSNWSRSPAPWPLGPRSW
jgi:rhamnose transport system ATP-binding protein